MPEWQLKPEYIITEDDYAKLIRWATGYEYLYTKWGYRDASIILLALRGGLRASEICYLNTENVKIDATPAHIMIMGKGNKWRTIPISDETRDMLIRTCEYAYGHGPDDWQNMGDPFIITAAGEGKRMTRYGVTTAWHRICERIGTTRRYRLHDARHTCATKLYNATKDILLVSRFLGHSRVTTTQVYAHQDLSDLMTGVLTAESGDLR